MDAAVPGTGRYSADRLPDVRSGLIEELALPPAVNEFRNTFRFHLDEGVQLPADPGLTDPDQQASLLVSNELARLRRADLYWVSPDMTRLTLAAETEMPVFCPAPADLPSKYGLIYFASPLTYLPAGSFTLRPGQPGAVITNAVVSAAAAAGISVPYVCAASWGPYDCAGRWPRGGTWFTFYSDPVEVVAHLAAPLGSVTSAERKKLNRDLPPLLSDGEAAWPADAGDAAVAAAIRDGECFGQLVHLVLCAFRLMDTARTARQDQIAPARKTRPRAEAARVRRPAAPVRLIDVTGGGIRRATTPGAQPPPDGDTGEPGKRQYSVRFPVAGHWRNQWYPSTGTSRPAWIDGYIKGPDGAPLKITSTVRVWKTTPPSRRAASGQQTRARRTR